MAQREIYKQGHALAYAAWGIYWLWLSDAVAGLLLDAVAGSRVSSSRCNVNLNPDSSIPKGFVNVIQEMFRRHRPARILYKIEYTQLILQHNADVVARPILVVPPIEDMAPAIPVYAVGSSGLKASAQGLGCMGLTAGFYKDVDHQATEEESIAVIHRAIELGVTLLDTSDIYGPFTNEELVGRALKGKRDQVQLCTKFAIKFTSEGGMAMDGSRKYVREACEASLKRLNTDHIDLYYMHRMDPKTPIEETMAELKALVEEGKIKYVGLSEVGPDDLRKAHKVHPITAVQMEWSLWTRDVEKDLVPVCRELGVGIVCYSPIGRGMLAGKYTKPEDIDPNDFRAKNPRFLEEAFAKNIKLVENVKKLAAKKGVTAGQMALAWLQHQGKDVFPIPGTKRMKYLEENAAAVGIQLSKQELKELEDAVPESQVQGARYNEAMMGGTYAHYKKAKPQQ